MEIKGDSLNALSFPDFLVECMKIDLVGKKCELFLEGAYLGDSPRGKVLPSGVLVIGEWDQLSVTQFESLSKRWIIANGDCKLRDVCEVHFNLDVILRGFSPVNDEWTEYKFANPKDVRFSY